METFREGCCKGRSEVNRTDARRSSNRAHGDACGFGNDGHIQATRSGGHVCTLALRGEHHFAGRDAAGLSSDSGKRSIGGIVDFIRKVFGDGLVIVGGRGVIGDTDGIFDTVTEDGHLTRLGCSSCKGKCPGGGRTRHCTMAEHRDLGVLPGLLRGLVHLHEHGTGPSKVISLGLGADFGGLVHRGRGRLGGGNIADKQHLLDVGGKSVRARIVVVGRVGTRNHGFGDIRGQVHCLPL